MSSDELLAALRADRQEKRRKKKERRRANRALRTDGVKAEDGDSDDDATGTARWVDETADDMLPNPGGGGEVLSETVSSMEEPTRKVPRLDDVDRAVRALRDGSGTVLESYMGDDGFRYEVVAVPSDDEEMANGEAATGGAFGAARPGQQRSSRRRRKKRT